MQKTSIESLAAVIRAAQQYDQAAYRQLYTQYTDPLYRYLYARCGDTGLAEDLLGELWLRVVEHLPGFRFPEQGGEVAFTAWLYRIARNLVLNASRSQGRRGVAMSEMQPAAEPRLDESLLQQEEHAAVRRALEHLTPDQREVLVLRFFQERTSAEVAALTGRTEGAVKALQHRALNALARVLGLQRMGSY